MPTVSLQISFKTTTKPSPVTLQAPVFRERSNMAFFLWLC